MARKRMTKPTASGQTSFLGKLFAKPAIVGPPVKLASFSKKYGEAPVGASKQQLITFILETQRKSLRERRIASDLRSIGGGESFHSRSAKAAELSEYAELVRLQSGISVRDLIIARKALKRKK